MSDREKFELIERYLSGQLTAQEQETFRELWATDPDFADQVNYHELVDDFIIDAGLLDLKEKLTNYTKPRASSNKGLVEKLVGSSRNLVLASLLMLSVGLGLGIWLMPHPFSSKQGLASKTPIEEKAQQNPQVENTTEPKKSTGPKASPNSSANHKPDPQEADNKRQGQPNQSAFAGKNPQSNQPEQKAKENPGANAVNLQKVQLTHLQQSASIKPVSFKIQPVGPKEVRIPENIKQRLANTECKNIKIRGEVEIVPSCIDKANGKLKVLTNTLKGGTPPYAFKFGKRAGYQKKAIKANMSRGKYTISVKDGNGCTDVLAKNARIPEERCGKRSFTFVPEEQTRWKYPFKKESASGRIKIFHEGTQVYTERINSGIPIGWNGRLNNGRRASMGLYRVIFNPTKAEPKIWLLTVIR